MERFVWFVMGGGVALVAGLWMIHLFGRLPRIQLIGLLITVIGGGSLLYGIATEIEPIDVGS